MPVAVRESFANLLRIQVVAANNFVLGNATMGSDVGNDAFLLVRR
jgi:hypothetical protein